MVTRTAADQYQGFSLGFLIFVKLSEPDVQKIDIITSEY
jgi:hypothetical protein